MQDLTFQTGKIKPVECYKEAWKLIKDQYWMAFAVVLVGLIVGSLLWIVLMGPMLCGVYMVLFDKYDEGKPLNFDKLFKGFDHFLPSLMLCLIIMVPMVVMIFIMYIPMIGMALAGPNLSETELLGFLGVVVAVEMIFAILMVTIHSLLLFSFQLLVDKKVGAWDSIKLSAKAVWNNKGGVGGLMGVGFVVVLIGYLMLCIGVYLTLPLIFAANVVAYRKVFQKTFELRNNPPPPNVYQGL